MAAVKQMGSLKKMLGMMPGMAQMREQLDSLDEREFDRVEAMVKSMTPYERKHPKIINGSRRARIARGSGRSVQDVNELLQRLTEAQKMMKQMRRGLGVPGMPGVGGPGRKGKGQPQRKKGKSGNPAKRAEQERAAGQKAVEARRNALGASFGAGSAPEDQAPQLGQLPAGFDKFLGR
jgi:signal recognition particle subunit SRP54